MVAIILFVIGALLLVTAIVLSSISLGMRDTGNELRKILTPIIVMNALGTIVLTAALFFYLSRNPTYSHLFMVVGFGISMLLSITAVSATALERAY